MGEEVVNLFYSYSDENSILTPINQSGDFRLLLLHTVHVKTLYYNVLLLPCGFDRTKLRQTYEKKLLLSFVFEPKKTLAKYGKKTTTITATIHSAIKLLHQVL